MIRHSLSYAAVAALLLLSGCDGTDSDDAAATPTALSGTFVDAPVEGLYYNCTKNGSPTTEGMTDQNGTFRYTEGSTCTFRIGQFILGSAVVPAGGRVTPYNLSDNNTTVANIASFLQTLDQNRTNGYLTIPLQARSDMNSTAVDFGLGSAEFATAMQAIATLYNTTVVSPSAALAAMDAYLAGSDSPDPDAPAGSVLTCDTSKFASGAAVASPTSADLISFGGVYQAEEGSFDESFNFTKSGDAMITLSTGGAFTYKNTAYATTSMCVETLSGGAKQLVLHTAKGHLDIGSDKTSVSGVSPADGTTIVKSTLTTTTVPTTPTTPTGTTAPTYTSGKCVEEGPNNGILTLSQCQANAFSDFSVTVTDKATGNVCSVTASNGTLTFTQGSVTASALLDSSAFDRGMTTNGTVNNVQANDSSTAGTTNIAVNWKDGNVYGINSTIVVGTTAQAYSCNNL